MGKHGKRSADCVTVCVRVRPMNSKEEAKGCDNITKVDTARGVVLVKNPKGDSPDKTYTFDHSFPHDVKQVDVYNSVARPIIESVLEGYNGTIFAYGQTGTGKTFTMAGDRRVPEKRGIIPNSFAHIFGRIAKAEGQTRFLVRVSYLEIYCEDIIDLLGDVTQKLPIKEHPEHGVYVKGLTSRIVRNADDMDKLMNAGNSNRKVGSTNMNDKSSRSHAIFTITIEQSDVGDDGEEHVRVGKLNLVDLAGSERQSKTGAEGQRLVEANKINWSLTCLGNVISALVDGKAKHIPYRESKLTRLLQDSLGGNAKTTMIANFGPADYNYDETISTLRYADRAKRIKNKPKINEDPKDALLREYLQQIQELKKQLGSGDEGESESSGDEEEGDSSDEGETMVGWDGQTIKKKKKRKGKGGKSKRPISPSKVKRIQDEIAQQREEMKHKKDMVEEEKEKAEAALREREEELKRQQEERAQLQAQMEQVSSKLIVGGVNLLDKAKEQEKMLEEAQAELLERQQQHEELEMAIEDVEALKIDFQKKYSSLEEEKADKTQQIKKLHGFYQSVKAEYDDLSSEFDTQLQEMDDRLSALQSEADMFDLILSSWIPEEYQAEIERVAMWNEQLGDWQIPGLPHTGNNYMRTQKQHEEIQKELGVIVDGAQQPVPQAQMEIVDPYDRIYLEYPKHQKKHRTKPAGSYRPTTAQLY